MRGMRTPSCLLLRMCRKARQASLLIVDAADGLTRFHAERMSVSGTWSDSYKSPRALTGPGQRLRTLLVTLWGGGRWGDQHDTSPRVSRFS